MSSGKFISINANLPDVDRIIRQLEKMGGGELPYTQEAVKTAAEVIQRYWINFISGATVQYSGGTFKVNNVSGQYMRSVAEGLQYPMDGDKLTGGVVSLSPHGQIVEDGIKPFDMKQTHLKGAHVKVGKDGKRYITVPFRHNTPGSNTIGQAMPKDVYKHAMNLAISRRNGLLIHWYAAKKYEWGGRLSKALGGAIQRPHWTTGKYSGMVKMGNEGHSQYLTFRRLSENSKPEAWKHPGTKPRPVTEAVEEAAQDEVTQLIRTGFEVDLASLGF